MTRVGSPAPDPVMGRRITTSLAVAISATVVVSCYLDNVTAPGADHALLTAALRGDSVILLGGTTRLSIDALPTAGHGPQSLQWVSGDVEVVTVDSTGTIQGVGVGRTTVVARLAAPELVSDIDLAWPVRVAHAAIRIGPVDSLTGLGERRSVPVWGLDVEGGSDTVVPAVLTSDDSTVLAVVGTGTVQALRNGSAVIVAAHDGLADTVSVRVRQVAARAAFPLPEVVLPALGRDTTFAVLVRDTQDSLIASPSVTWSSSDTASVMVDERGVIRALRRTPGIITARIDTVAARFSVAVVQTVTELAEVSGNGQTRAVGATVPVGPSVVARDAGGYPVPGVTVVFSVAEGDGELTDSVQTTNEQGVATLGSWRLGAVPGTNRIVATGAGLSVEFTAVATTGPVSPATSSITVSQPLLPAGNAAMLVLQTRDGFGNPVTAGGRDVSFTASGGSSTGQIGAVTDNGDGSYSAAFVGSGAGTSTTIRATINGAPVTSPLPSVTVVASAPTQLSVTAGEGQQAAAGTSVPVAPSVTIRDAFDNPVLGVTVVFAVTAGGGSVAGASTVTDAAGLATATSWTLGPGVGENRLQVTAATLSTSVLATGIPGPASSATSQLTSSADTVAAGTAAALTLRLRDQFGNALSTGGHAVTFTASGGTSVGDMSAATDRADGTYTATFAGVTAGSATTIGATIDGSPLTSSLPRVAVRSGAASVLTVVAGDGQAGTVGEAVAAAPAVELTDAFGNPIAGVPVTFAVTQGGGSVLGGMQISDAAGRAAALSWTLGTTPGQNALGVVAADLVAPVLANATPGPTDPGVSQIVAAADTVSAGSTTQITLRTRDRFGNDVPTGGHTVAFFASGGTSTGDVGIAVDHADGTYVTTFSGVGSGSETTIGATIDGVPVTTGGAPVAVVPGPPAAATSQVLISEDTVTAGAAATLTLLVADQFGNAILGGGLQVSFGTSGGTSSGTIGPTSDNDDGSYTASFSGVVAGTATSVGATMEGVAVTTPSPTIVVRPGAASGPMSEILVSDDTIPAGTTAILTLRARDAFGNALTDGGLSVVFARVSGSSTGVISPATDNADGTYEAGFSGETAGTPASFAATLDGDVEGDAVSSAASTVTVIPGTPVHLGISAGNGQTATVNTAVPIAPVVLVRDAFRNTVSGVVVTFAVATGGGSVTGASQVTDDAGAATVGSWVLGTAAGVNQVLASMTGLTDTLVATAVAGPASPDMSTLVLTQDSVGVGADVEVTLQARDQYGNDVLAGGNTVVFYADPGSANVSLSSTADQGDGTYTATITGLAPGTATIRARLDGADVNAPLSLVVWIP